MKKVSKIKSTNSPVDNLYDAATAKKKAIEAALNQLANYVLQGSGNGDSHIKLTVPVIETEMMKAITELFEPKGYTIETTDIKKDEQDATELKISW